MLAPPCKLILDADHSIACSLIAGVFLCGRPHLVGPILNTALRFRASPSGQETPGDDYRLCHHRRRVSRQRLLAKTSTNATTMITTTSQMLI
jgi:hypothetical protein